MEDLVCIVPVELQDDLAAMVLEQAMPSLISS
jgi:hypothetical protein